MIEKANGRLRLITDFKKLNDKTQKESYPFPCLEDQLQNLKGAEIFSQLDLDKGFYQIPIAEQDTHKTAFVLPFGHFEYLRLPFGMANSPRSFQRSMNTLFEGLPYVKVFVDDILIYSKKKEEHIEHVETTLNRIISAGGKINFDKSKFGLDTVEYLGFKIDKEGYTIIKKELTIKKLDAQPINKKQLQKFIGTANWFRKFIPDLSKHMILITDKLKEDEKKLKWKAKEEEARKEILQLISKAIKLYHSDPHTKFILECDASENGIGGVLIQNKKIINVHSKKLNASESNYSIVEKELYAIIKSVEAFKKYIWCAHVCIKTDSKNISYLKQSASNRIGRWRLLLEEYDYCLTHIAGENNCLADMLSRDMVLTTEAKVPERIRMIAETAFRLKAETEDEVKRIIKYFHDQTLHSGMSRLYERIRRIYQIENLKKKIKEFVSKCEDCQRHKKQNLKFGLLNAHIEAESVNELVCSDIVGPYEIETEKEIKKIQIITAIDCVSRYVMLMPATSVNSSEVCKHIKSWIRRFGCPQRILTDQGPQYISEAFKQFCESQSIKHITPTAYNPQGNGMAERINQTISFGIRMRKREESIEDMTTRIQNGMNTSFHTALGSVPEIVMTGIDSLNKLNQDQNLSEEELKKNREKAQATAKIRMNKRRIMHEYEIGKKVHLLESEKRKGKDIKKGPFTILDISPKRTALKIDMVDKCRWVNIRLVEPFVESECVMN